MQEVPQKADLENQVPTDFYQNLRIRLRRWLKSSEGRENKLASSLMYVPDFFHLMVRLTTDKQVPSGEKVKLGAAITYYILPFDLIPEAVIGVAGFADDLSIAVYVVHGLLNRVQDDVVRRHWCGEDDILTLTQRLFNKVDNLVGGGLLWDRLKKRLGAQI